MGKYFSYFLQIFLRVEEISKEKASTSKCLLIFLQVYSPDRQAFVHNVGSTDSERIKDILWLFKIPFNQIYLLWVDLGKELEFLLTNTIFNDACSSWHHCHTYLNATLDVLQTKSAPKHYVMSISNTYLIGHENNCF